MSKYASTSIVEKDRTGNPANKKVTDDIKSYIETLIEYMPSIVLSEMRLKILNEKNLSSSVETIRICIKSLGITRSQNTTKGIHINSERNNTPRKDYARIILEVYKDDNLIVFVEESGFNMHIEDLKEDPPDDK